MKFGIKSNKILTKEEFIKKLEKEKEQADKKSEKLAKKLEKLNNNQDDTKINENNTAFLDNVDVETLSSEEQNNNNIKKTNSEQSYFDFINKIIKKSKEQQDNDKDKVVSQEDGTKQSHKARNIVIDLSITVLIVTIIGIGSYELFKNIKRLKDKENDKKTESIASVSDNTPGKTITKTTSDNSISDNTIVMDEEVEKVVDVNSEEYIMEVANDAWSEILDERLTNNNFAASMDEDYIKDLVKYVHHDEEGYVGLYNITNDNAYGNFFELAESDKVIGTLFTGLDSEEYITNLNVKLANTVDNGDYKEEYEAFAAIEDAIDNVDLENVPESYAMMAMLDKYLGIGQDMEAMILDNKYEILGQEVVEEYEKPRDFDKWKMLYENLKKTNPNYLFANTWDIADKEDANMEEYNKAALEKMNSTESIETIYNEKATDYDTVAQGFYNQIQSYRNQYGSFADEFTSVNDVKEFIIFVNQFKNPNMKSSINSLETFESMLQSYYNSCAVYGIDPNLSELFEGYSFAQNKLAEAEDLAANLKNGKGDDYSIANKYYKWMGENLYMVSDINISMKENAPLVVTLRNQFAAYRLTGNMLNARKYQKTYDLGLGADGQLVCPDSIDDYMINQTIPEGGHVINEENTYDTFGTAYDYIKQECKGLSK